MRDKLKYTPFFLPLIPLFFALHGWLENLTFISIKEILLLAGVYILATLLLFILFYFFYKKSVTKAALISSFIMYIYLFFGAIQDSLKGYGEYLYKFSILLPAFLIITLSLIIYLKKTQRSFKRLFLFLNLLLTIFLIIDITLICYKKINPEEKTLSVAHFTDSIFISPQQPKPDIYFLVFDEYACSASLKKYYGFDNALDSFLLSRGFSIQTESRSNYNFTTLSMASILNLTYLKGIDKNTTADPKKINQGYTLIKDNELVKILTNLGYEIKNYSTFDFKDNPTSLKQTILPLNTKMITGSTLFSKLQNDVNWPAVLKRFHLDPVIKFYKFSQNEYNKKAFQITGWQSAQHAEKPVFVYTHFLTPHAPFFYNKEGQARDPELIINEGLRNLPGPYLENLVYTNQEIKALIDTIQYHTKGRAVIIVMGDHGFRVDQDDLRDFCNMNAIYFPGKNYGLLQDSITCVNQFRIIFNSLFGLSIPLLKDSTFYLKGK